MATGSRAKLLKAMGSERAAEWLHRAVQTALAVKLLEPIGIVASAWVQNPLTHGSYMYPTVSAQSNEAEILRQPIAERIFLAGEALAGRCGYVDGAWHDGQRAAALVAEK
jgi:monoamine oxidase